MPAATVAIERMAPSHRLNRAAVKIGAAQLLCERTRWTTYNIAAVTKRAIEKCTNTGCQFGSTSNMLVLRSVSGIRGNARSMPALRFGSGLRPARGWMSPGSAREERPHQQFE